MRWFLAFFLFLAACQNDEFLHKIQEPVECERELMLTVPDPPVEGIDVTNIGIIYVTGQKYARFKVDGTLTDFVFEGQETEGIYLKKVLEFPNKKFAVKICVPIV